jgi:hypothetical protein
MTTMSSSLHPILQLADDSVKKITSQLNSNTFKNSCSNLRGGSKSRKDSKNNKVSYILGNGSSSPKTHSNVTFNCKFLSSTGDCHNRKIEQALLKEDIFNPIVDIGIDTDRKSEATTLREAFKSTSDKRFSDSYDRSVKKKRPKKSKPA